MPCNWSLPIAIHLYVYLRVTQERYWLVLQTGINTNKMTHITLTVNLHHKQHFVQLPIYVFYFHSLITIFQLYSTGIGITFFHHHIQKNSTTKFKNIKL